jgi:hypothetical protein
MQLKIEKNLETADTVAQFLLVSNIASADCENARMLAVSNDFVFELQINEQNSVRHLKSSRKVNGKEIEEYVYVKQIAACALFKFLQVDKETQQLICNWYKNLDSSVDIKDMDIILNHLFISCQGRIEMSILNPQIESGYTVFPNVAGLKVGVGFSFQAGIKFSTTDIICS